ncbi:MAG: 2-oxoacid:ferredoxin oxidoreductase subunit beta [Nanoarchaeota archaeon]|nr:2-oxoacid:ferredoxin oxidoreductase subunit beta [Nanoarchaeota archaeon]
MTPPINLSTSAIPTWCPGCPNFMVLAGVKKAIMEELQKGKKKEDIVIVTGIGCHAKIFDYINLNGINTLHGRVLPTCLGIKIGNPNLTVLGFSGDGDAYAEGMEHLIHMARYNSDIKYFVHDNRVFALTVGQPTPTTEIGYKDKTTPEGTKIAPINPLRIMLASGASFVARVYADVSQVENVMKEALKHKGFAFIEILEPCLIFHPDGIKEKIYSLEKVGHNKSSFDDAWKKAGEFDYSAINDKTKIPTGIFYQAQKPVFEEQFPQLMELKKKKIGWKDVER